MKKCEDLKKRRFNENKKLNYKMMICKLRIKLKKN